VFGLVLNRVYIAQDEFLLFFSNSFDYYDDLAQLAIKCLVVRVVGTHVFC
jgi:hypothetical protein